MKNELKTQPYLVTYVSETQLLDMSYKAFTSSISLYQMISRECRPSTQRPIGHRLHIINNNWGTKYQQENPSILQFSIFLPSENLVKNCGLLLNLWQKYQKTPDFSYYVALLPQCITPSKISPIPSPISLPSFFLWVCPAGMKPKPAIWKDLATELRKTIHRKYEALSII